MNHMRKIFAGNWKMNPRSEVEVVRILSQIEKVLEKGYAAQADIIVFPPSVFLHTTHAFLVGQKLKIKIR